ncbi:uncharacterized protein LOC124274568 [Haliotis rubra]|uniref:uncharacterized protein LOC124274568 n=1 Tax=Haliotis rubra TaxID=36100 RepID=UPI001EE6149D|nr:uncharacterized protein LOC124274568 [Haliotis rubra]
MFERAVFLLYLPAICFSFALFPNAGHETQRRQNPEQNIVNASSGLGREEHCLTLFSPCFDAIQPMLSVRDPQSIVVDGRLAVPCESNILEESWNCLDATSQCSDFGFYTMARWFQISWEFICQNGPAFVAGEQCWNNSRLQSTYFTCLSSNILCRPPTCIREGAAMVPDCSTQDSIVLSGMAAAVFEQVYGC